MKINIAQSPRGPLNLKAHVAICKTGRGICVVFGLSKVGCARGIAQFLGGTGDYLQGLYNSWVEQLSWDELRNFSEEA